MIPSLFTGQSNGAILPESVKTSVSSTPANNLLRIFPSYIRTAIFGSKPDPNAANKKIHMFRRWMVRNDGIVDLGVWKQ